MKRKLHRSFALALAGCLLAGALSACGAASSESPAASAPSEVAAASMPAASVAEEVSSVPASSSEASGEDENGTALPDGAYTADFETDSTMFHANEACDGTGTLIVQGGEMTFHVSLVSKSITNLYVGTAEDAQKDGAVWLEPTADTVTYSDGSSEEVYGFDIPVERLNTDFSVAILGKKGTWYDHTVSVRNARPLEADDEVLADGAYTCAVTLEGGSGKASVESPAKLTVEEGTVTATLVWSSKNYDYMLVGGEKYLPTNTEGNSTFEIPVDAFDVPLEVVADTVAMSTPHEIEYTLTFDSETLESAG